MIPRRAIFSLTYWPILLTCFLVCWTTLVSPYSKYGDYWAIVPALLVLPLIVVLHIVLLVRNNWDAKYWVYGLLHTVVAFLVLIWCLTSISKDSL
jgi:hypothetical protein